MCGIALCIDTFYPKNIERPYGFQGFTKYWSVVLCVVFITKILIIIMIQDDKQHYRPISIYIALYQLQSVALALGYRL